MSPKTRRMRKVKAVYMYIVLASVSVIYFNRAFLNSGYESKHSIRSVDSDEVEEDQEANTFQTTKATTQVESYTSATDLAVARNNERLQTLKQQCAIKQSDPTRNASGLGFFEKRHTIGFTDERFSVVYCRINKCASTFTIKTLSTLLGWPVEKCRNFSTEFRILNYQQKLNIFDTAYTFLFVREPYGRLFATYSNKFYFPKGNWAPVATEIVKRYRKNPPADSLQFGHDITFAELIRFTVEDYNAESIMDSHIRPMHVNCKPCDYHYDFIGKMETMIPDWKYLVQQMKNRTVITDLPRRAGQKKASKELIEMKHFFETLIKVKNSTIDFYHLYRRAWRYFQMTSVISKQYEMPFSRHEIKNMDNVTFLAAMERASRLSKANVADLKLQNYEAMLQAYATVPSDLMEEFRKVVLDDCLLFGYEDRPRLLFDEQYAKPFRSTFDYFSNLGPFK